MSQPARNPSVVLREEFDDWAVLYNPDTAEAAGINPVGVAVWKLLDGRRTAVEVAASIREQFKGVPGTADEEIAAFVRDLAEKGFIGYEESPE